MNGDEPIPNIDLDTVSLLVPRAKDGSEQARDELLEHVQDYMLLMARQNTPGDARGKFGSSDVVQHSLAQVIQGFDNFRGSTAKEFYAWLKVIVANEAKKLHRDHRRAKRDMGREQRLAAQSGSALGFAPADERPTPGTQAIAAEQIEQLHAAIERMPSDYAEVIRLRGLDRLTFKEVAERMGRSMNSVTKLWYRAAVRLQEELETDDDSGS